MNLNKNTMLNLKKKMGFMANKIYMWSLKMMKKRKQLSKSIL